MEVNLTQASSLENINSELVLLTIESNNDYKGKLFVATIKAKNEKDRERQELMAKSLSAYLKELTSKENNYEFSLMIKTIRKVSCLSPTNFISALTPKENIEEHKQKFLLMIGSLSVEKLIEIHLAERNAYLSDCCQSCKKDFQEIRLGANQEAFDRFFFCSNSNCINFGLKKKNNK